MDANHNRRGPARDFRQRLLQSLGCAGFIDARLLAENSPDLPLVDHPPAFGKFNAIFEHAEGKLDFRFGMRQPLHRHRNGEATMRRQFIAGAGAIGHHAADHLASGIEQRHVQRVSGRGFTIGRALQHRPVQPEIASHRGSFEPRFVLEFAQAKHGRGEVGNMGE